ncbi:hypothetical protein ACSBR2_035272 [Camellia fascicularis]
MPPLMARSLSLEHFLLTNSLSNNLMWCSTENLSYATTGKVAMSACQDIDVIIHRINILSFSSKNVEEGSSSTDDSTSSDFFTDSDESYNTESESAEVETEDDDEEEEAPKKVVLSKKRPAESATKTPGPDKKAKLVTPQKTDAKKGSVHVATPHPKKQAGKTPGNQSKQPTPKSAGSNPCKSCNKSFNSENALESHTKAKHSAEK